MKHSSMCCVVSGTNKQVFKHKL